MHKTKLHYALSNAKVGLHIFPLIPDSKKPLTANGFKDATTDFKTIREWWTKNPEANIGIALDASNICVIDVDIHGDVNGFESIHELGDLPLTATSRTGSGGCHYIYSTDGNPPPRKTNLVKGIDLLANGYIVAPNSVVDGNEYKWETAGLQPVALPQHIRELASPKVVVNTTAGTLPKSFTVNSNIVERARNYISQMPEAVQGMGGHSTLFKTASVLVKGFALPEGEACSILWSDFNPRCNPPWDRANNNDVRDFERKVKEAVEKSNMPLGYLVNDQYSQSVELTAEAQKMLDDFTNKVFNKNKQQIESTETLSSWEQLTENILTLEWLESERKIATPSVGEYQQDKFLFYRGEMNEIHGQAGISKSWIALYVSMQELRRGNSVLYLDPESSKNNITKRLEYLESPIGELKTIAKDSGAKFLYRSDMFDPRDKDNKEIKILQAGVQADEFSLVVIDGIANYMANAGYDENDNMGALQIINDLCKPFAMAGKCVLIIDHTSKNTDGTRGARGASSKRGAYKGASYLIDPTVPFSRENSGYSTLILDKDNEGGVGYVGQKVAKFNAEVKDCTNGNKHTEFSLSFYDKEVEQAIKQHSEAGEIQKLVPLSKEDAVSKDFLVESSEWGRRKVDTLVKVLEDSGAIIAFKKQSNGKKYYYQTLL
jgi:hypothetical protein